MLLMWLSFMPLWQYWMVKLLIESLQALITKKSKRDVQQCARYVWESPNGFEQLWCSKIPIGNASWKFTIIMYLARCMRRRRTTSSRLRWHWAKMRRKTEIRWAVACFPLFLIQTTKNSVAAQPCFNQDVWFQDHWCWNMLMAHFTVTVMVTGRAHVCCWMTTFPGSYFSLKWWVVYSKVIQLEYSSSR